MRSPLVFGISTAVALMAVGAPIASADRFDNQVGQLQQQNTQTQQNQQLLAGQATSLQQAIAQQQAQIAELSSQIQATQTKITGLQQNIAKAQTELAQQQQLLGLDVRQMYTEGNINTLEMLASSKNLSYFVDRVQYQQNVGTDLAATVKRVKALEAQLQKDKQSAADLLKNQQTMQAQLDAQRANNARLLSLNQAQQEQFQQSLDANNAQIAALRKEQAAINEAAMAAKPVTVSSPAEIAPAVRQVEASAPAASSPAASPALPAPIRAAAVPTPAAAAPAPAPASGGAHSIVDTYPWANAPFPNSIPDPWGMYERQCVSYTAWKVASSGRYMPYWGGSGDAKEWVGDAESAGIPVDHNPHVGDVAISVAGPYGHAMYVEAVNGNGTVTVSQYNADWQGRFSVGVRDISGLYFIHF